MGSMWGSAEVQLCRDDSGSEQALVTSALPQLRRFFTSRFGDTTIALEREVRVGANKADVVAMTPLVGFRTLPPLTAAESHLLACIRCQRGIDASTVAAITGLPRAKVVVAAARLARRGLLAATHLGKLNSTSWQRSAKVVAFEGKLSRWREALAQASTYLRYADEAYVILPLRSAAPAASSAHEFVGAGVGLLTFDGVHLRRVIRARRSHAHDWQREFVVSRLASKELR